MSQIVQLEDGTEIELNDNIIEEIEAKAVQKFREENPDIDRIDELKAEAEEAQVKLQEIEEKQKKSTIGQNLSELRKQKEAAEAEAKAANEKLTKEVAEVKNLVINKTKTETLKGLIGDDEEMNKKVQHIYDTTLSGMPSTTDEEIAERVRSAYKLAKPEVSPSKMGYDIVSSSGATGSKTIKEDDLDPEFAQRMGLDPDKIKKLRPKVKEMKERRFQ